MKLAIIIIVLLVLLAIVAHGIYIIVMGFINAKNNNKKAKLQKHRKLISQLKTVN